MFLGQSETLSLFYREIDLYSLGTKPLQYYSLLEQTSWALTWQVTFFLSPNYYENKADYK